MEPIDERLRSIKSLRLAFEKNCIFPYFQPIIDVQTQSIAHHECLARMRNENGIVILPSEFIALAKKSGMMNALATTIISQSFNIFANANHPFSINIASENLRSDHFVNFIKLRQSFFKIPPEKITLELIEDVSEDALERLRELKQCGFKIALDDIGLTEFKGVFFDNLRVDCIKIHGELITQIDHTVTYQNIVSDIVKIAKERKIAVVAKHVSSQAVFETIKALGVDFAQGHYFYKALEHPLLYRQSSYM